MSSSSVFPSPSVPPLVWSPIKNSQPTSFQRGGVLQERGLAHFAGLSDPTGGDVLRHLARVSAPCELVVPSIIHTGQNILGIRFPLQCRCMRAATTPPTYCKLEGWGGEKKFQTSGHQSNCGCCFKSSREVFWCFHSGQKNREKVLFTRDFAPWVNEANHSTTDMNFVFDF